MTKIKKKFTEEQWAEMVDFMYDCILKGHPTTRIKTMLFRKYGLPISQFIDLHKDVKKKIYADTDIYNDAAKELQIARLQELLNDVVEQGDSQMALKVIAELSKLLSLYEQKVKVDVQNYEIKL